jgi:predicted acylesterase/phospholipase RssA
VAEHKDLEKHNNTEPVLRIGLGLSGGGFRASIFHLGVILRLEELGIMPRVNVISSVSGGSIIAAYYVIEMERRLRAKRDELNAGRSLTDVRVELFHEIAADFFRATDHNLRSRALVFFPFYHPITTVKMFRTRYNRSDVMQAEYDRWFYRKNTLDQLPSVADERQVGAGSHLTGPKLLLNTASLLTGKRVSFSREPISGAKELSRVDKNVLPLSRIVGASAGVPVLFPPTYVSGDMLVDGGVSDNQGLEALWEENCDALIISDASGQMKQVHRMPSRGFPVLSRTNTIFQFQIRKKLIDQLILWRDKDVNRRSFAFVHLHLNLKDRSDVKCRAPSEYIPGLARIRTDLDQFSFVEREVLMYHGYTLIDGQLRKYCKNLINKTEVRDSSERERNRLRVPPLFERHAGGQNADEMLEKCEAIKKILNAGSQSSFLLRAIRRYRLKAVSVIALTWVIPLVLFFTLVYRYIDRFAEKVVQKMLGPWFDCLMPGWLGWILSHLKGYAAWPVTLEGITVIITFLLLGYLLIFLTYLVMRRSVRSWDLTTYRSLTGGTDPGVEWLEKDETEG